MSAERASPKDVRDEVHEAEREVERSAAGLETAMDHLGGTIERATRKVQRISDFAQKPKYALMRARSGGARALSHAKSNPAPFALGAGVLLLGAVSAAYARRWGLFGRYYLGVFRKP